MRRDRRRALIWSYAFLVVFVIFFLTPPIYAVRDPLFFGNWPHLSDVIYVFGVGLAMLVFASYFFRRVDDQLAAQL